MVWKSDPRLHMHARKNRLIPRYEDRNGNKHEYYVRHEAQAIQKAFVAKHSQFIVNTCGVVVVTAKSRRLFSRQTNIFSFVVNETSITCA